MSGRIVSEVVRFAPIDLTHLEVLVLVCLAEGAREDRICRHGASTTVLADKARTTPGTVRNVLARLRDRGLIVPLHEKPRKGLAQEYRIATLTPAHRKAILTDDTTGDVKRHPRRDANGTSLRHALVTQSPVDNHR